MAVDAAAPAAEWGTLLRGDEAVRASSSVSKEFSVKHAVDGSADTCWTSAGCRAGSGVLPQPHHVSVKFKRRVEVHAVALQFQAGFVARECLVQVSEDGKDWRDVSPDPLRPRDSHDVQLLPLAAPVHTPRLRVVFSGFSDMFGRITLYAFDVQGVECSDGVDGGDGGGELAAAAAAADGGGGGGGAGGAAEAP